MAKVLRTVMVLLVLSGSRATGHGTVSARQGSIAGTVIDAVQQMPLSDVRVTVPGRGLTTMTDAGGHFVIGGIESGVTTISLAKSGYVLLSSAIMASSVSLEPNGVVIRMLPAGTIMGRLAESRGISVADVSVRALFSDVASVPPGRRDLTIAASVRTDDRGMFRLIDLPPGDYLIAFSHNRQGVSDLVTEAGRIAPVLYPNTSELRAAIPVRVEAGKETRLGPIPLTARLGAVRFHLRNPSAQVRSVKLKCCDWPLTRNRVSGAFTIQVPGLTTGLRPRAEHIDPGMTLVVSYWPSMPGTYTFEAEWEGPDGLESVSESVEFVGADTEVHLDLIRPSGHLDIVIVTDRPTGQRLPVQGVRVSLSRDKLWVNQVARPTRADGRTALGRVPVGIYDLVDMAGLPADSYVASARQGNRDALVEGVMISSDSPDMEIRLGSGRQEVSGTVRSRGVSVHDSLVSLIPISSGRTRLLPLYRVARTDQTGSFKLSGIRPGKYRLIAWSPIEIPFFTLPDYKYLDSEFISQFSSRAMTIEIMENERSSVAVAIPSE